MNGATAPVNIASRPTASAVVPHMFFVVIAAAALPWRVNENRECRVAEV